MKVKRKKYLIIHSSDMKISLRSDLRGGEESKEPSPVTLLDLSKKNHRKIIIAEHKSIIHLVAPKNDLLRVFKTPTIGFGVVAHQPIKKNQIICNYHGKKVIQKIKDEVITGYEEVAQAITAKKKHLTKNKNRPLTTTEQEQLDEYARQLEKSICNYVFVIKETKNKLVSILSHQEAGIGALVNCSCYGFANALPKVEADEIIFYALRDINPGEEILIDYGFAFIDGKEFQHIFPIGSRSIETFLTQNAEHYPTQPTALNETERTLLGTQATHVLLPHYYSADLQKLKNYKANQINILPIIEMAKAEIGSKFKPLPSQQFITGLMYTCLKANKILFNKLIQKRVCANFVTRNGRSAWYILTANHNDSPFIPKMCEKLTKAIYQLYEQRGWADAYVPYIQKNLHETSTENQEAIFSTIFTPPPKTIISSARKKSGYKIVEVHQPEVEETSPPITENTTRHLKRKADCLEKKPIDLAMAIINKNVSAIQSFLDSASHNKLFNLLKKPFETGEEKIVFHGCRVIALAAASGHLDIFQCILTAIGATQMLQLINLRQRKGQFLGLTALGIAIINRSIEVLTLMLATIPADIKFNILATPQPEGAFQGCSVLTIAVFTQQFSAVHALLTPLNNEQKIALITTYQTIGRAEGFNAISMAIKLWNFELLHCLLNALPLKQLLDILNTRNPTGVERGLSALDIAKKYQKPDDVKWMLKRINPLLNTTIASNEFTLFNTAPIGGTQAKTFASSFRSDLT
jgi:hypothetical protein